MNLEHHFHEPKNAVPGTRYSDSPSGSWLATMHVLDRVFYADPRVHDHVSERDQMVDWARVRFERWPLRELDYEFCDNWAHHFKRSEWHLLDLAAGLDAAQPDQTIAANLAMLDAQHYNIYIEALAVARATHPITEPWYPTLSRS